VAEVPRVLLDQVEQNPLERRRGAAVPPVAGLAEVGEVMRLDDGPGVGRLRVQRGDQPDGSRLRPSSPAGSESSLLTSRKRK
jgi:hypothetical protein